MCDTLRKEFQLKNFGFSHGAPEAFVTTQWRWNSIGYLIFRIVMSCYTLGWLLALFIVSSGGYHNSMVFLTVWTYLMLTIYTMTSAITAVVCHRKLHEGNSAMMVSATGNNNVFNINTAFEKEKSNNDNDQNGNIGSNGSTSMKEGVNDVVALESQSNVSINDKTRWYMKLTWLLANIVYVFGMIVSVVYFAAIFPYTGINGDFAIDINMHGVNTVLILIDAAIVARPVRLLHAIYPTIYGCIYIIFSTIYWSQDKINNVLYPHVLDWNHPVNTAIVIVVLAVIVIPLFQLIHFGIYRLRVRLHR